MQNVSGLAWIGVYIVFWFAFSMYNGVSRLHSSAVASDDEAYEGEYDTRAIARIILENEDYNVMKVKIIEEEDRQTEPPCWPLIRYAGPCVVSAYTLVKIIMN